MTDNLSYCASQVREHDPDRFLTCLFAPVERREALFALYALNYELAKTREVVRETMMGRIRLQWWREAIEGLYAGEVREHQVLTALAKVLPQAIDMPLVHRLIEARELDLEERGMATGADLIDYTRATGGTLMHIAARLLGAQGDDLLNAADDLGEAVALTGLLRAVPFHDGQNRLYLPSDLLRQMGVDPEKPLKMQAGVDVVTYLLASEAERLLATAPRRIPRRFIAAYLPAAMARATLRRMAQCHHDPFAIALNAPDPARSLRLARAWAGGRV